MQLLWILVGLAAAVIAVVLLITYLCFRLAFYVPPSTREQKEKYPIPEGKIYEPYREKMIGWMKTTDALPCEHMSIRSFDGLLLRAKYYEYAPGAPIELMFHGYRGDARRDLCGGVQRCAKLGRSALIVDQRACGQSEGNIITFGVNESKDCHSWLEFMLKRFGPDVKIHLTGISMGAATVMMAAGKPLPKNVVGILADCGYTSPKDIICKVIRQMKLPPKPLYPFVKLAARIFAHFDLEEMPPVEALQHCPVPVIFYHGDTDDYVPCEMSRENYEACRAPRKKLVVIPGAGHGLCYVLQPKEYVDTLREFYPEENKVK